MTESTALRQLIDTIGLAIISFDRDWRIVYASREASILLHCEVADLVGHTQWELFPGTLGTALESNYRRAVATGSPTAFEHYYSPFEQWYEISAHPDEAGLHIHFRNIEDRHRADEQRVTALAEAAAASQRLALLAEAGHSLAASLDVSETLTAAMRLLVPRLGDSALVHWFEGGELRLAALHHEDAQAQAALARAFPSIPNPSDQQFGAGWVATHGQTQLLPELTDEILQSLVADPQLREALRELKLSSGAVVPLMARGRTLGALSLGRHNAPLSSDDVSLLEEVAARVAIAADNARLYADAVRSRKDAEQARARAQESGARLALLSEVSRALTEPLELGDGVGRLAALLVPGLADLCIISLYGDPADTAPVDVGSGASVDMSVLRDVGSAYRDPERLEEARAQAQVLLGALASDHPLLATLGTGKAQRLDLALALANPIATPIATPLLDTAAFIPLTANDQVLGAISLFNDARRGPLSQDELSTASDVGARTALALANRRLFERQRRATEVLQRSLLTAPPEPDHLHVTVRYQAAVAEAQVGGDWYDAFLNRDGSTVLVIGDVMGHDSIAAAAMGQLRTYVRSIGYDRAAGPAEILTRVDHAIAGLQAAVLATTIVLRIEQSDSDRDSGLRRVRWSSAGHPAPMLLTADGAAEELRGQADLLLGLDPKSPRHDHEAVLDSGSTLLLYTDGLVERRTASLDQGIAGLQEAMQKFAPLPLDEFCDRLLETLLPGGSSEDDVALVAVRAFPEDEPRPREAGPVRVPQFPEIN